MAANVSVDTGLLIPKIAYPFADRTCLFSVPGIAMQVLQVSAQLCRHLTDDDRINAPQQPDFAP